MHGATIKMLTFHLVACQLGSLRIYWWYTETVNISFSGTPARKFENSLSRPFKIKGGFFLNYVGVLS